MADGVGLSVGATNLAAVVVGRTAVTRSPVLTLYPHRPPEVGVPSENPNLTERGLIITGFVANFNHLDTFFPLRFYQLLTIALVATGGALAVKLVRIRSTASEWLPFTAFALAAVSGLTAFLLVSAYRLMISTGGWLIQGRYFLPLAALFAIFLAASALAVGRRAGLVVAVALICGFGLLNLASLGLSLSRFYV